MKGESSMSHGPEPCENCGSTHPPAWWHYDENGEPRVDDIEEPEVRLVVLHGMADDGRTLWVDAPEESAS